MGVTSQLTPLVIWSHKWLVSWLTWRGQLSNHLRGQWTRLVQSVIEYGEMFLAELMSKEYRAALSHRANITATCIVIMWQISRFVLYKTMQFCYGQISLEEALHSFNIIYRNISSIYFIHEFPMIMNQNFVSISFEDNHEIISLWDFNEKLKTNFLSTNH